ncbi:MAG: GspH/FimT family pseudopilin [Tepidisphaeraceae bacterium]
MTVRPLQHRHGFTMIEIVLVVIVIALALSVAAPSLTRWGQGSKLDDAARQFQAAAQFARSESIANATPYRIEFDATGAGYSVLRYDGQFFQNVPGEFGQGISVPSGFSIRLVQGGDANALVFQPTGRTTPGTVRVTSPRNDTVDIASNYPSDLFRIVLSDEEAR